MNTHALGPQRIAWAWVVRVAACLLGGLAALTPPSAWAQNERAARCPPAPTSLLPAQATRALETASDRGLLWRIERDGTRSYLYGTLHVGRNDWLAPGPKMRAALDASDVLALEIDGSAARTADLVAQAMRRQGPGVDEALRIRVGERLTRLCVPARALSALNPVMQAVMLGVMVARLDGLHSEFGSEPMLTAYMRAQQRRVVSLETVQRQFNALIPQTSQEANDMISSTLEQHDGQLLRPMLARMVQAWERGDAATLERFTEWCNCLRNATDRVMLKRINDDRNEDMARGIEALHRGGKRVFAAVGALHMTGELGLPRLLAARGFTVERVQWP
jgi:uncharacterized protein